MFAPVCAQLGEEEGEFFNGGPEEWGPGGASPAPGARQRVGWPLKIFDSTLSFGVE